MDAEQFSREIIRKGSRQGWQDVYILPEKDSYSIYYRIGSRRRKFQELDSEEAQQLINRFKFLGQMDVGERRRAQLGAITQAVNGKKQRLRLSTVGDYQQRESLVIRFLFQFDSQEEKYALPEQVEMIQHRIDKRGLYLFSGPVGSGKTTLMYKLARALEGQVVTIEDPVEIEEPVFLQLQTNPKIGQSYDELIRLSLRHHPDVLIIGEIRDEQTAQAAIRAALTGHYVFATIHARGLDSVKARLLELGRNPSEINECLQGVIYQEMCQQEQVSEVLCGYQFFNGKEVIEEMSWQQSLSLLRKKYEETKGGLLNE